MTESAVLGCGERLGDTSGEFLRSLVASGAEASPLSLSGERRFEFERSWRGLVLGESAACGRIIMGAVFCALCSLVAQDRTRWRISVRVAFQVTQ